MKWHSVSNKMTQKVKVFISSLVILILLLKTHTVDKENSFLTFVSTFLFLGITKVLSFLFLSFLNYLFVYLFCFFETGRVSLCSPGCQRTHSLHETGLKLTETLLCASWVLELKVDVTTWLLQSFLRALYLKLYPTWELSASLSAISQPLPPLFICSQLLKHLPYKDNARV